jgi:FAD/FMN-containing dehydrogenase
MVPDMNDPAQRSRAEAALDRLFAQVLGWGGVISGEHGIGLAKKRWFSQAASPVARSLHARLKHALDPGEILNPGKFIDQRGK